VGLLERRLLAQGTERATVLAAAEECLLDLGRHLVVRVGIEGYCALLERALQLSVNDYPGLSSVRPRRRPPGRVNGLQQSARRLAPDDLENALVLVIANLIWLLTQLIGQELSLRVLGDVWPGISEGDLGLS